MMLWSKYNWLCNLQLDFSLEVSFLSVVTLLNPRFLISSTFLSISFSSLYSQPVLSQAENRFLNRQDSGDRAENHYWPRLGSIATTMASPDNRTDCHGYQIVNAHSRWKPLRPAFPFLKELCFKGKKIDIYSLFRQLQCLSTPHVTIKSKIGWEYSKCIVFFSTLQATFLPFQRCLSFCGIATYGDVFLLQRLLIPHQARCAPVQQLYVCQAAEACRSNQSPHFLSRIESFHESFCDRPFSWQTFYLVTVKRAQVELTIPHFH